MTWIRIQKHTFTFFNTAKMLSIYAHAVELTALDTRDMMFYQHDH